MSDTETTGQEEFTPAQREWIERIVSERLERESASQHGTASDSTAPGPSDAALQNTAPSHRTAGSTLGKRE